MLALLILLSLLTGYYFRWTFNMRILNNLITVFISLILFIMGYNFGDSPNIFHNLIHLFHSFIIMTVLLFFMNFFCISVLIYIGFSRYHATVHTTFDTSGMLRNTANSMIYVLIVIIGMFMGYYYQFVIPHSTWWINGILISIVFMLGHQMRKSNFAIKQILLNRVGVVVAIICIISSIFSGILAHFILHIPLRNGLILASGFAWYTLSGTMTANLLNSQMGLTIFFIDFFRELLAITLLPLLPNYALFGVSYCGASALDFALPMIRQYLGVPIVPIAITSGLILTALMPPLLTLYSLI